MQRPITYLVNLDPAVMPQLSESESGTILVSGLIEFLHHLGIKVGAEGVETECQIKLFNQLGCDEFNGTGIEG